MQLALPTRFAQTVARRLGVVLVIHAVLAVLVTALLQAAGWWTPPLGVAGAQLAWLAPIVWLMGLGALAGLLSGARSLVAGVLGVWWLVQNLFVGVLIRASGAVTCCCSSPRTRPASTSGWPTGCGC